MNRKKTGSTKGAENTDDNKSSTSKKSRGNKEETLKVNLTINEVWIPKENSKINRMTKNSKVNREKAVP